MGFPQGGWLFGDVGYRVELFGAIGSAGICYLRCWSSDHQVGHSGEMEH